MVHIICLRRIFRCGRAACPVWREPPFRTNRATLLLFCLSRIQTIYLPHGDIFGRINTFNVDFIRIVRDTIYDCICQGILFSYYSSSRNCEQKIGDAFFLLLCISSKRFLASASFKWISNHSSRMRSVGFVYFFRTLVKFPSSLVACKSNNKSGSLTYFIVKYCL